MADYTAKRIDDMQAAYGGGMVKVRAELGVSSFGVQMIQLPPNYGDYPEHDHLADGQEEIYFPLSGSGHIDVEGERVELSTEMLVRVGPGAKRKIVSGPDGMRFLAVGGAPGQAYKIAPFSELAAS